MQYAKIKEKSISKLMKELDAVFSKWVRESEADEYGYCECYTCGNKHKISSMNAGHFLPRKIMPTRWDEMNVKPQCVPCNYTRQGEPQKFREHLVKDYGEDAVKRLEMRRHNLMKMGRFEYEMMISKYKKKMKELCK